MAKTTDNWPHLVVGFAEAHKKQAEALGNYVRSNRIALTLTDCRAMVKSTKDGAAWTGGMVPANVPTGHREAIAQLLNVLSDRHRAAQAKRRGQRERIDQLRRQIPPADWERLRPLRHSFFVPEDARKQADMRTAQAVTKWLSMTPADRDAWFARVDADQRQRHEHYRRITQPQATGRQAACMVLSVPFDAPAEVIKQAYRQLAKQHHPDLGGNVEQFQRVQQAYEQLLGA